MNVYDTANKLAFELKNSQEYKSYKEGKEKIEKDPVLKEKLENFEKQRYEIQLDTFQGKPKDEEKLQQMQQTYTQLIQNPILVDYFNAELKFNVMFADINKIIGEAVQDVLK